MGNNNSSSNSNSSTNERNENKDESNEESSLKNAPNLANENTNDYNDNNNSRKSQQVFRRTMSTSTTLTENFNDNDNDNEISSIASRVSTAHSNSACSRSTNNSCGYNHHHHHVVAHNNNNINASNHSVTSIRSAPAAVTQHLRNHPFMMSSSASSASLSLSSSASVNDLVMSGAASMSYDEFDSNNRNHSNNHHRFDNRYNRSRMTRTQSRSQGSRNTRSYYSHSQGGSTATGGGLALPSLSEHTGSDHYHQHHEQVNYINRQRHSNNAFARNGNLNGILIDIDHRQGQPQGRVNGGRVGYTTHYNNQYYPQRGGRSRMPIPVMAVPQPHGGHAIVAAPPPPAYSHGHPLMVPPVPMRRTRSAGGDASVYSAQSQNSRPRGILRNGKGGERQRIDMEKQHKRELIRDYFSQK